MPTFNRTILDNGLTILTIPQKDSLEATALVLVRAGSKYETKEINGISHFLEHMCFKGTEKRPTAMAIATELEGLGAQNNAFTSFEHTGYYARSERHVFPKVFEIVADLYMNPTIPPEEVEREKGPVIEEINMRDDDPSTKLMDAFPALLYGDQPAGWDIVGDAETIRRLTREQVVAYREAHYVASSTVVVVSGGIDEKAVLKDIETHFGHVSTGKKAEKLPVHESQSKPELLVLTKETAQTNLLFGFRAYPRTDPRRHALAVLAIILGGGMSSRLFERIRERMGLAYHISAGADLLTDHGFMYIFAGVGNDKLDKAIPAILEECRKLTENSITEEELTRAKNQTRGSLAMGLTNSIKWALMYGEQEILGKKIETPDEILEKVNAVTKEDVRAAAKDIFRNEKLNLGLIGPHKDKERFQKILTI